MFWKQVSFMHAIVRTGNKGYYISAVFGYYRDGNDKNLFNTYYIILDKDKKNLIRQPLYNPKMKPYLDMMVLIVDDDDSNWIIDVRGFGGVDFLPKEQALTIVENGFTFEKLYEKCIKIDSSFQYSEYNEIKDKKDIDRLMLVSGCFHDALITKIESKNDGTLYVLFEGVWGCSVEIFFSGDVSYCTDSRNSGYYDPYWSESSIIMQDDFLYLVDDANVSVEKINDDYCWFKAKSMKYHIIPN